MHAGIPLTFYFFFSLGSQPMGWCCSLSGVEIFLPQLHVYGSPSQAHPEMHLLGDSKSSQADSEDQPSYLSKVPQLVRDGTRL